MKHGFPATTFLSWNGATGTSDIEHAAIGNRAGRRQRSYGSWREHEAVRVIQAKLRR